MEDVVPARHPQRVDGRLEKEILPQGRQRGDHQCRRGDDET